MEVENVLSDQYKLEDAFVHEFLQDFPLQFHNIVLNGIIPLPDHLDDGILLLVVGQEDLQVERTATEIVPLGMNIIVVDGLGEFEFGIGPSMKRRAIVFLADVDMPPVIKGFYVVHPAAKIG